MHKASPQATQYDASVDRGVIGRSTMSGAQEGGNAFQQATARIGAAVQLDVTGQPPAAPATPPETPKVDPSRVPGSGAPAPTTVVPTTPGAAPGTLGGKFKSEDEAIRAHHLLIHSLNEAKAREDAQAARIKELEAKVAVTPAPLSPGRVDPVAGSPERAALGQKFVEQYGIDPKDVEAFVTDIVRSARAEENAPLIAARNAEAYMDEHYPDFRAKVEDVKAFVAASPWVKDRVSTLYNQGLFAEAMEIGYLAYDNALRTVQIAEATQEANKGQIDASRRDGVMISSQASGPREPIPTRPAFPQTPEEWEQIREMRRSGRDEEVRARLFGPLIAGIPDLNPRR